MQEGSEEPEEGESISEGAAYAALLGALAATFGRNGNHRHDFQARGFLARAQRAGSGGPRAKAALEKLNAAFPGQMVKANQDPNYEKYLMAQIVEKK